MKFLGYVVGANGIEVDEEKGKGNQGIANNTKDHIRGKKFSWLR